MVLRIFVVLEHLASASIATTLLSLTGYALVAMALWLQWSGHECQAIIAPVFASRLLRLVPSPDPLLHVS